MQEVILNLLPVTEEEKGEFAAIAPRAEHIYTRGSAVTAECFISNGLPAFEIVGLPDAAVK